MAYYLASYDTVKREDIDEIHNITAFLNQTRLPDIDTTMKKTLELFSMLVPKTFSDKTNPFALIHQEVQGFGSTAYPETHQQLKELSVRKLTKSFASIRIENPENLAKQLIEFGFKLSDHEHPFLTLVNQNIAKRFNGFKLHDLHQANIAKLTF
jgi:hypothetical protein